MAHTTYNAVTNTNSLRDTWDMEMGLNPTEETKVADWVEQPIGAQKFGNNLYLRKIPALVANAYTPDTDNALRANLTWNTVDLERVSAPAALKYSAVGLERAILNRTVEDGALRAGFRKQLMAVVKEAVDSALFALASSASAVQASAAVDDAAVRGALAQLAANAKGKFTEDSAKLLVVHPDELANVWNIPAVKEYQIRGTIGAAVNLKLNAYGLIWRESGLVLEMAGVQYHPILLKDGWALAFNEKPHILDVQFDGLSENFIAVVEYGVTEWFDSSVVVITT